MSLAAGRPCTSGIPSPPDTTTARPAVQCCAVPFPANGLHSALHGEARQHIRNPHSIVLRQFWSRKGVFGARTRNRQNKLNLLSAGPAGLVFLSLFPASQFSGTQSAQSVHALIRSSTDSPTQACSVALCGLHEKFTFLPFTAEKQTFHATLTTRRAPMSECP